MKKTLLLFFATLFMSSGFAQCTDWVAPTPTDGYTVFNTDFGGAPCNDGTGCPVFQFEGWEVWQSEAYAMANVIEGGNYTFSICNGPGAGSWVPEFTIIAPSGAIDAFGAGDGDGCSITWTATEDGDYLIVINEAGACGVEGQDDNGYPAITCSGTPDCGPPIECDAGIVEDTTPLELCPDEEGVFSTADTEGIPQGNGYALYFVPTTGTGALGGAFHFTGVTLPVTFDADLGGALSGGGFPPFEGEWEVYGSVYADAQAPADTECDLTEDFILVDFLTADDPACDGGGGDECTDWVAPTPTDGYTVFNTDFGGAPCNDGTGCPVFQFEGWEVWQSEAYAMANVIEGGNYTFSICNGAGAGSWVPEFTIIAPSGAIDAFGAGDGDGCSITWTATEDGEYLIVINEAGACGVEGQDDNGFPAITCNGTPDCGPPVECDAGIVEDTTPLELCPDDEGVFSTADTEGIPQGNGYALYFVPTTGTGALGGAFHFTGVTLPVTFDADLGGALSGGGFPPFEGEWEVYGSVYADAQAPADTECDLTEDFILVDFLTADDPACEGGGSDECTDWVAPSPTEGYDVFNVNFGGAPCNDGSGCPTYEYDGWEVWQSEAYAMANVIEDGNYTFSICNGAGAGSWVPEFTIIAPSGAIDAFGAGDGDGCSITWTASESGDYLIVINEAGACGVAGEVDNGFPAITCNGTPMCPNPPANDDCADAEGISPGVHDFTTLSATTDGPDQPGSDCENFEETNLQQDIWYEYTATCDGAATMSTCGTANFDTRLGIYPAGTCPPDGGSLIACNDDGDDSEGADCPGFTSVVTWDIMEGETYLLRIGGFDDTQSGSGTFELIEDCITSIDEQAANFSVFPNPNNGQFALEFAGESGVAQIDVLDVSGKSVHSEQRMMTSGSRMDIDLGNVSGMYFVRMTMNDNVQMLKVIVQ